MDPDHIEIADKVPKIRAAIWQERFIRAYARHGILLAAAEEAGVSRTTAYRAIRSSPQLRARMEAVKDEPVERVENVLGTCAMKGEPWAVKLYLKAHKPELYGDRVTVNMNLASKLAAEFGLTEEEVLVQAEAILAGR